LKGKHQEEAWVVLFVISVGAASEVAVASYEMGAGHVLQVEQAGTSFSTVTMISCGPPSDLSESYLPILALRAFK
jgi:hypothetical protein